jgi:hypothetical protein
MTILDVTITLKILLIATVAYLVITAWDEFYDRLIMDVLGLDPGSKRSWLIVASISTGLFLLLLYIFHIEAHDIFGISESVDISLKNREALNFLHNLH